MLTAVVCSGRNGPHCSKGPVRGHGQRAALVCGGGEAEQRLGAGVVEWREADLVEDEEIGSQQGVDDLADGVVGQAAVEGFDRFDRGEVADFVSGVYRGDASPIRVRLLSVW